MADLKVEDVKGMKVRELNQALKELGVSHGKLRKAELQDLLIKTLKERDSTTQNDSDSGLEQTKKGGAKGTVPPIEVPAGLKGKPSSSPSSRRIIRRGEQKKSTPTPEKGAKRGWGVGVPKSLAGDDPSDALDQLIQDSSNMDEDAEDSKEESRKRKAPEEDSGPPVPAVEDDPTTSLRIDGFVRPFRVPAAKQLLGEHGTVVKFWMNSIKTHCYVQFESVTEAEACVGAVHGKKWPATSVKKLTCKYVSEDDVENKLNPPEPVKKKRKVARQVDEDEETPAMPTKTLDELFRKTKTEPCLYWLPLTDAQAKERDEARQKLPPPPPSMRSPLERGTRFPPRGRSPPRGFRGPPGRDFRDRGDGPRGSGRGGGGPWRDDRSRGGPWRDDRRDRFDNRRAPDRYSEREGHPFGRGRGGGGGMWDEDERSAPPPGIGPSKMRMDEVGDEAGEVYPRGRTARWRGEEEEEGGRWKRGMDIDQEPMPRRERPERGNGAGRGVKGAVEAGDRYRPRW